jgi:hypothetical protein
METLATSSCKAGVVLLRLRDRSWAKIVMRAMRCTKLAGLGALSALCVLKSSSSLYGLFSEGACCVSAEVARARCAIDGGLKEESRIYSVFGCVVVGFTVRTTRNLEGEEVKECSEESRSGSSDRNDAIREAISAMVSGVCTV